MIAYHGKQDVKDFYLNRVEQHRLADEIVQGQYWDDGKGCAVGCTIHGSDHAAYETEIGIPEWLARLEDALFEGMPIERSKVWPKDFLEAIRPGADLEAVKTPFLLFILEENLKTLDALPDMTEIPGVKNVINLSREATKEMIRCHREELDLLAAARSAESAVWSAESAVWSAARSAVWSAESVARSAVWSAAYEKYADKLIELIKET